MINIILGDDNITYTSDIVTNLNKQTDINLKGFANNVEDFMGKVEQDPPEIAVLDFMDPIEKGLRLIDRILREYQLSVIVISDVDDDNFVAALRDIGVAYYLMKPFSWETLVQRIKYVHEYHENMFNLFYVHDRRLIQQFLIDYFSALGIPPYLKGHRYLLDAVMLVSQDNSWLNGITKRLYPAVARCNRTSASHVERTIRYAIDTAWSKGDFAQLQQLFPYTIDPEKGKPTNSAFIAKMADIINFHFKY
ncbi:MAG: response regulator [Firmicutes bacterium]|mgnify:CR=1 FL=1|nr:response regulator [Bacillota bacterium]